MASIANVQPGEKDKEPTLEAVYKDAKAWKSSVLKVMAEAVEIGQEIENNPQWKWARNDENRGLLNTLAKTLREKMTPFHRRFVAEDEQKLKREMAKDTGPPAASEPTTIGPFARPTTHPPASRNVPKDTLKTKS